MRRNVPSHMDQSADLADGPTPQQDPSRLIPLAAILDTGELDEPFDSPSSIADSSIMREPALAAHTRPACRRRPGSRTIPLTIDHRAGQPRECERLLAAGARVHPKRLANGAEIGEPRMWLQDRFAPNTSSAHACVWACMGAGAW